jgi:perosamine synthetase
MELFTTKISEKSKILANQVLDSTFVSSGKMADMFENMLSSELSLKMPVSVNSGTSALHLALDVAGVGPGDEVILPAQTFIATGFVILMLGAKPVFADIQLETGNIDPVSIRDKITEKTKAIIPVHWGGYPCDLDEINLIAKEFNLIVIEDAAHALGATYKSKPIGSISNFTCFSFQAIKHITSGDGGAICCLDEIDHYKLKRRRWFDIDRENSKPDILGERVYDAKNIGYKYHMNDLAAAVAIGNLEDFSAIQNRLNFISDFYIRELKNISGLTLLNYRKDRQSANWLFTIKIKDRVNFITALKEKNIPSSVVHLRIDKNSVFGGINEELLNQKIFDEEQVSIPIHANLTDEDINKVVNVIKKGW